MAPDPHLPDYGGRCVSSIVPGLLAGRPPEWFPAPLSGAGPIVLLVLDGLGWEQLEERRHLAPNLTAMAGGPITSVAPTTTATALTSIVSGLTPGEHGIVGYRMHVGDGEVLNVLRWRTDAGDARERIPPATHRASPPFLGEAVPAVVRAEFRDSGFTEAHLRGARLAGWRMPSTIVVEVSAALAAGNRFVYAYYDGIDKVAHEFGLAGHYDAELAAADALVGQLAGALPPGGALVVTSDHGQVDVGDRWEHIDRSLTDGVWLFSGEGRFVWLHCEPGATARVRDRMEAAYGDRCWVRTRHEIRAEGWFGPTLGPEAEARLGDVAVVPFEPIALLEPDDEREVTLMSRHGSLTSAEVLVPLLAVSGSGT